MSNATVSSCSYLQDRMLNVRAHTHMSVHVCARARVSVHLSTLHDSVAPMTTEHKITSKNPYLCDMVIFCWRDSVMFTLYRLFRCFLFVLAVRIIYAHSPLGRGQVTYTAHHPYGTSSIRPIIHTARQPHGPSYYSPAHLSGRS